MFAFAQTVHLRENHEMGNKKFLPKLTSLSVIAGKCTQLNKRKKIILDGTCVH